MSQIVSVLGAGSFGTAIAMSLARCGHEVLLFCRTPEQSASIAQKRENITYFPNHKLLPNIHASADLERALAPEVVCLAFPARVMDDYIGHFEHSTSAPKTLINLVKGLHIRDFTFAKLIKNRLPNAQYAALKGPTFAKPLFFGEWSGLTCGTTSEGTRTKVASIFRGDSIHLDFHDSAEAVDGISAIKNVYAIVLGIASSQGLSENTQFLVMSLIIRELAAVSKALGYSEDILFRYCGLGDTLLTGLCDTSRNRTIGVMIGKGIKLDPAPSGFLAEGVRTISMLHDRVSPTITPLLNQLIQIMDGSEKPTSLVSMISRL